MWGTFSVHFLRALFWGALFRGTGHFFSIFLRGTFFGHFFGTLSRRTLLAQLPDKRIWFKASLFVHTPGQRPTTWRPADICGAWGTFVGHIGGAHWWYTLLELVGNICNSGHPFCTHTGAATLPTGKHTIPLPHTSAATPTSRPADNLV